VVIAKYKRMLPNFNVPIAFRFHPYQRCEEILRANFLIALRGNMSAHTDRKPHAASNKI